MITRITPTRPGGLRVDHEAAVARHRWIRERSSADPLDQGPARALRRGEGGDECGGGDAAGAAGARAFEVIAAPVSAVLDPRAPERIAIRA
jgi:hypothetical protein